MCQYLLRYCHTRNHEIAYFKPIPLAMGGGEGRGEWPHQTVMVKMSTQPLKYLQELKQVYVEALHVEAQHVPVIA